MGLVLLVASDLLTNQTFSNPGNDIGDELGLTDPFKANAPVSLDYADVSKPAAATVN